MHLHGKLHTHTILDLVTLFSIKVRLIELRKELYVSNYFWINIRVNHSILKFWLSFIFIYCYHTTRHSTTLIKNII